MAKSGNKWIKAMKWLLVAVLFSAALGGSAWVGVLLAKKNLPAWVGDKVEVLRGEEIVIGGEGRMVYLAEKNQIIKDFYSKHKTEGARLKADVDEAKVLRLSAQVMIKVKRRDAGTVSIMVLSGPLNGEVFWMPVSQLSQRKKGEDLPLIKADREKEEPLN